MLHPVQASCLCCSQGRVTICTRTACSFGAQSTRHTSQRAGLQALIHSQHVRCDALAADTDGVQRQCEPEALRSRSLHQAALTPQSQTGQAIAPAPVNRREFVLHSVLAPALALALAGSGTEDPVTVLNSVLSAYGLPMLKASKGYTFLDDFEEAYVFEYPSSWVKVKSKRLGIIVSNYQTADKASVISFPYPSPLHPGSSTDSTGNSSDGTGSSSEPDAELLKLAVARVVVPDGEYQADDKLTLPPAKLIKAQTRVVDGKAYTYLSFPSETLTRSGYQIRRENRAVVAVRKGVAYVLSTSARGDQYDKAKAAVLQHVVESFRLRD